MNKNIELVNQYPSIVKTPTDEHLKRLMRIKNIIDEDTLNEAKLIANNSGWYYKEIVDLFRNGFCRFVGLDFLKRCKYAAGLIAGNEKDCEQVVKYRDKKGYIIGKVNYAGDIQDSILDKIERINSLSKHWHTGLTTNWHLNNISYMVVSTVPLPISIEDPTDPILLAFKKWTDTPIYRSVKGKIETINRMDKIGSHEFVIVGIWDIDKEIL